MVLVSLCVFVATRAQITQNDGYYFQNGKLFTGIFQQHDDAGQLTVKISVKNGLPDGSASIIQAVFLLKSVHIGTETRTEPGNNLRTKKRYQKPFIIKIKNMESGLFGIMMEHSDTRCTTKKERKQAPGKCGMKKGR